MPMIIVATLCQTQKPNYLGEHKTYQECCNRWNDKSHGRPFLTARFLVCGKKRGGARPVKQGEEHHIYRCQPGPSITNQNCSQFFQVRKINHLTGRQVHHEQYRNHNLVGWQSQYKGQEYKAIQSYSIADRL